MKSGRVLICALALLVPGTALAHAFGVSYSLPLPTWLYLLGGAIAVILSFVVVVFFLDAKSLQQTGKSFDLSKTTLGKLTRSMIIKRTLQGLSLFIFGLVLVSGLFGKPFDASLNFSTIWFWIIFMLGFTYLTAVIGNIWPKISPFRLLTADVPESKHKVSYPKFLGYLPALIIYLYLIFIELNGQGANPARIGYLAIYYLWFNLAGVYILGKQVWFKYFEFFEVFFRLVGKVSPFYYADQKLKIGLPFVRLVNKPADHFSLVAFIAFMLASTAFDGFKSTIPWLEFNNYLAAEFDTLPLFWLDLLAQSFLPLALGVFLGVYLMAIAVMKLITGSRLSVGELAKWFALSLVPIAIAYNVAHYYPLLLIQGQSLIAVISDPLDKGWDLFGTKYFALNFGLLQPGFVWNSQVAVIVLGHVAAVFTAHLTAVKLFANRRTAMISQLPMLGVMVSFTVFGLWILSQPLSVGR